MDTDYDLPLLVEIIISIALYVGYMVAGLLLLANNQHRYPAWLRWFSDHRGFIPFFLHWLLWPLSYAVVLVSSFAANRRRRRSNLA